MREPVGRFQYASPAGGGGVALADLVGTDSGLNRSRPAMTAVEAVAVIATPSAIWPGRAGASFLAASLASPPVTANCASSAASTISIGLLLMLAIPKKARAAPTGPRRTARSSRNHRP